MIGNEFTTFANYTSIKMPLTFYYPSDQQWRWLQKWVYKDLFAVKVLLQDEAQVSMFMTFMA